MPIAEPAAVNKLDPLPGYDESLAPHVTCEVFYRAGNVAESKVLKAIMTAGEAKERLDESPHAYSASGIHFAPWPR